jgi:transglutaminase-like putative cysteine protease
VEFTILHQTTYRYPGKIHESYSVVRLRPRSDSTQYCTKYELTVAPRTRVFSYVDRFGNEVQHFAVLPEHDVLSIAARSSVITVRSPEPEMPAPVTMAELAADRELRWLYDELHESQYIVFGPGLRAFATEVGEPEAGDDLAAWYVHAATAIHESFAYDNRRSDPRARRRLPGLRPRFGRALPLPRHPRTLRERLRLQRTGGVGPRRRRLACLV